MIVALGTRALDDALAMGTLEEASRLAADASTRELALQTLREAESLRVAMGRR